MSDTAYDVPRGMLHATRIPAAPGSRWRRLVLAACLLPFGALGAAPGASEEEGWTPYAGFAPRQVEGFDSVLVIDALTKRPVAGATIEARWEDVYENGAWAPLESSGVTDAHGIYCAKQGDMPRARHWEVRAPGYEPEHEYSTGPMGEVMELRPAIPKHGRIVDFAGRPLGGVTVKWKRGCAHAPTHGSAVSDAEGRFVLREGPEQADIGIYAGPGVLFAPYSVEVAPTWAEAPWTVAWPGIEVAGEIMPPHGRYPLTLASQQETQGPLLALPQDGKFRLPNVRWDSTLAIWDFVHPDAPPETRRWDAAPVSIDLETWTPGAPIRVSPAKPEIETPTSVASVHLQGTLPDDHHPITVHFDRVDGRRFSFDVAPPTDPDADPWELPAGPYTVRLDAPFARYEADPLQVRLMPGEAASLSLTVRPCPELHLPATDVGLAAALGATPEAVAALRLFVAAREPLSGAWRALQRSLGGADEPPIHVTPGCEVTLWARGPLGTVRFRVDEEQGGGRKVTWTAEPGGALDIVGAGAEAFVDLVAEGDVPLSTEAIGGGVRVRVAEPGRHVLAGGEVHAAVQIPRFVPGRDVARLEGASLRPALTGHQRLEVRLPPGLGPLGPVDDLELEVGISRLDGPDPGTRWWREWGAADDEVQVGETVAITHAGLAAGAHVLVRAALPWTEDDDGVARYRGPDIATQIVHLEGDGPWTHEIPARGLDLRVRLYAARAAAEPARFSDGDVLVLIGGEIYAARAQPDGTGLLRVRGLPAGPVRIAVMAGGYEGRQRVVTLASAGVAALEVALPALR